MKAHILSGIDRIDTVAHLLEGKRVGLMTNPTGIDHNLKSTIDIVAERFNLTALFAVEHGIRGDIQAGEHVADTVDPFTGVKVYSAYGKTAHFSDEMLDAFDVLIFDIQDVGARFYTYIYSMGYAMESCNRAGKSMIVLDRINPIGGLHMEGTILDPNFKSFVGDYALPSRHGMTCGEVALYVKDFLGLTLDLTVVPVEGWKRSMYLDDTDLPWVAPSPNLAKGDAFFTYIATCIFEGTNLSEGRGTTLPFEVVGAPYLNSAELEAAMAKHNLPGVHFRRTAFCPTFSKHAGKLCHGVQLHVTDREKANLFEAGMVLLDEIKKQAGDNYETLCHVLEMEGETKRFYHMDRLLGTDAYRLEQKTTQQLVEENLPRIAEFAEKIKKYYLYD